MQAPESTNELESCWTDKEQVSSRRSKNKHPMSAVGHCSPTYSSSGSNSWSPLLATVAILLALPCLQIGLLYKHMWYSNVLTELHNLQANCSCTCYDGFMEGRAYYTMGRAHFYTSTYRHVYVNTHLQSALLLAFMSCSVLLLHRAVESAWRLPTWHRSAVCVLLINLLMAYDLFWTTFQAANSGRSNAALHSGAFYALQCCLCWILIPTADWHSRTALSPLALNWAVLLTGGPLLVRSSNLLTLMQYVSREVVLRDYLAGIGHAAGLALTLAFLSKLPAADWKQVMSSSRLLCLDAGCVLILWIFNILT